MPNVHHITGRIERIAVGILTMKRRSLFTINLGEGE